MHALREEIRSYRVMCRCWEAGIRPGFTLVGGCLALDGTVPQAHFPGCQWVAAVNRIYEEERAVDNHG